MKNDAIDHFIHKILEDDGIDPLTAFNQILAHDMNVQGYDWTTYRPRDRKRLKTMFDAAPEEFGEVGEFEQEKPVQEAEEKPKKAVGPPETNGMDARVMSTNPEFNRCPAYLQGICRIDGRPCAFNNQDYRECGKYFLATSSDPELFEVPFGREQATEYILGIRS